MDIEQVRKQAKDESTAPEILAKLAENEDRQTRKYVAGNPNTPKDVLLKLAASFPFEFFENPILDLLILENLNLANEMPPNSLWRIMSYSECPDYFLQKAGDRAPLDTQLYLVDNIHTSPKTLRKLRESPYSEVVEAAKVHINSELEVTTENLQIFINRAIDSLLNYRSKDICWQSLNLLAKLCPMPNIFIQHLKSNIQNTKNTASLDPLHSILKNENYNFESVKNNPNTLTTILDYYGRSSCNLVSYIALLQPQISPQVSIEQSGSLVWLNRLATAQNPQTSLDILRVLVRDCNQLISVAAEDNLEQISSN